MVRARIGSRKCHLFAAAIEAGLAVMHDFGR
jgi:hypothetical protein